MINISHKMYKLKEHYSGGTAELGRTGMKDACRAFTHCFCIRNITLNYLIIYFASGTLASLQTAFLQYFVCIHLRTSFALTLLHIIQSLL